MFTKKHAGKDASHSKDVAKHIKKHEKDVKGKGAGVKHDASTGHSSQY
jgi:hypothetical protein